MMKTPFRYLLYRELVLSKKALLSGAAFSIASVVIGVLVQLSIIYGNINTYFGGVPEIMEACAVAVLFIPVFGSTALLESLSHSTVTDCETKWVKFCLSTPASPVRLSMAKYTVVICSSATAIVLTAVYYLIVGLIGNAYLSCESFLFAVVILMFFLILGILMQILVTVFRSLDKAGIAFTLIFGIAAMAVSVIALLAELHIEPFVSINDGFRSIVRPVFEASSLAEKVSVISGIFPVMLTVTVAMLIIGFVFTVRFYKRRER